MENNKNKKSVKFQGDMLYFCDFIQVFVFTTNHHLKNSDLQQGGKSRGLNDRVTSRNFVPVFGQNM